MFQTKRLEMHRFTRLSVSPSIVEALGPYVIQDSCLVKSHDCVTLPSRRHQYIYSHSTSSLVKLPSAPNVNLENVNVKSEKLELFADINTTLLCQPSFLRVHPHIMYPFLNKIAVRILLITAGFLIYLFSSAIRN